MLQLLITQYEVQMNLKMFANYCLNCFVGRLAWSLTQQSGHSCLVCYASSCHASTRFEPKNILSLDRQCADNSASVTDPQAWRSGRPAGMA